ncbi:trigger factor [Candidatus Berkelbacteria bacterium]|nr:trigger factor [Candidatus Berkelbacteria bacterium]
MKTNTTELPNSRIKIIASLSKVEVDEFFTLAAEQLSKNIKITGFRPGKAPLKMVREQLSSDILRDEAYTQAVRKCWQEIIPTLKKGPIQDPEVEVGEFKENQEAELIFLFDTRPEVKVTAWDKIKLTKTKKPEIKKDEVDDVIRSLQKGYAATVVKLTEAKAGDKVEVTFTGSIKGVQKDKLSSKHFPVVIGEDGVIPGFAEQLIGLKKNDTKKFSITFPVDHYDKELKGAKVDFEVTVEEVFDVQIPELTDGLAKKFGHDKVDQLRQAITEDLERRHDEEYKTQLKAEWLEAFEKCVKTDLPITLVESEVDRSRLNWEKYLEDRKLTKEAWFERTGGKLEDLEKNWQEAAKTSVRIGLGLAEVARTQNKELVTNEDFQKFLDELVEQAIAKK